MSLGFTMGIPFNANYAALHAGGGAPPAGFQYIVYANSLTSTPASTTYTDGTTDVRKRDIAANEPYDKYVIDITLTPTGFAGVENTDWENLLRHGGLADETFDFRSGVRGGFFVVDGTLDGTGFAGVEDTNWTNLAMAQGAGAQTTFRDGVRDAAYVIDKTLNATGFAGDINVDWENIETHS